MRPNVASKTALMNIGGLLSTAQAILLLWSPNTFNDTVDDMTLIPTEHLSTERDAIILLIHHSLTFLTSLKNITIYCSLLIVAKRLFRICLLWLSEVLIPSVTCLLQLNFLLNRVIPTHNSIPDLFVKVKIMLLVLTFLTALLTTPSSLLVKLTP